MDMKLIERLKAEYVGQWIGLKDDRLVATSDSHRELYKLLKEKSINGAYIFYSPTEEQKRYGFLF